MSVVSHHIHIRTFGKVGQAGVEQLLLLGGELRQSRDVLHTLGAELDGRGEEVDLVLEQGALDEGALRHRLTVETLEQALGEDSGGVGHRERRRAGTVLGLDDLVTTELDAVHKLVVLLASLHLVTLGGLRDQGHNGHTRVATNDGDVGGLRVRASNARQEGGRARGVERGHTEEALGVVHTGLLEHLSDDRHRRVDGVRDDADVSLWGDLSHDLGEVTDNRGVRLYKLIHVR